MAESSPAKSSKKRAPIPPTHTIHKRPALRPSIPSPYSGRSHPKVIYVQARTPFISAIQRAQKLLELIRRRDEPIRGGITDKEILVRGRVKGSKSAATASVSAKAAASGSRLALATEDNDPHRKPEEVYFKGTGKAIQRVLELGLWFQQRHQYRVKVTAGEVGVIDDIEEKPIGIVEEENDRDLQDAEDVQMKDESSNTQEHPEIVHRNVPETRIRKVSMVQVAVSWR